MYCVHTLYMIFCVSEKSAASSGATLLLIQQRYLPNSISFICRAQDREAVSTIFKVFSVSIGWIKTLDLPNSQFTLYHCTLELVKYTNKQ